MKLIVLALLPVLTFGRQASAPTPSPNDAPAATEAPKIDPALLADIRRLLEISGAAKLMEQQFDAALAPAIDMLRSRGRDASHPTPPARIRTGATNAYGSYLG